MPPRADWRKSTAKIMGVTSRKGCLRLSAGESDGSETLISLFSRHGVPFALLRSAGVFTIERACASNS